MKPIVWFGAGVLSVWAFHKWVKPMPTSASR